MTICPRLWDLDVSDCQVGTVLVFNPARSQFLNGQFGIKDFVLTISKSSDHSTSNELAQAE
jgi:hypothetical protein